MKTKLIIGLVTAFLLFSITTTAQTGLPFRPDCTYYDTPNSILPGWDESYDSRNRMQYCLYNSSVFHIRMPVDGPNRVGNYFISSSGDLFNNNFLLTEQGNVRGVEVKITMYAPSHSSGQCLVTSNNLPFSPSLNSPMSLLVANHQNGFSEEVNFDDAFIDFNDPVGYPELLGQLACDEWVTFQVPISDFTNDYGSSFAGHSKTVGTLGLEPSNIYVSCIQVIGTLETITLFGSC